MRDGSPTEGASGPLTASGGLRAVLGAMSSCPCLSEQPGSAGKALCSSWKNCALVRPAFAPPVAVCTSRARRSPDGLGALPRRGQIGFRNSSSMAFGRTRDWSDVGIAALPSLAWPAGSRRTLGTRNIRPPPASACRLICQERVQRLGSLVRRWSPQSSSADGQQTPPQVFAVVGLKQLDGQ